jgi:hypothetical protein
MADGSGDTVRVETRLWFAVDGGRGEKAFAYRRHWAIPLEVPRAALEPRRPAGGPDTPKPA